MTKFQKGVLTGELVQEVFKDAKENLYALPAVNVTNSSTVNAVLEAAAEVKLGGYSGKGFQNASIKEGLEGTFGLKNVSYFALPEKPWETNEVTLETKNSWFEISNGFKASYFNNPALSGTPVLNRTEHQIDHHWTLYGPDSTTGNSFFSARWEAQLIGKQNTELELGLAGNDGFRLYLNDTLRIDQWGKQGFHERKIAIDVKEGQQYQLRIEFREPQGNGRIKLFVEEPSSIDSQTYLEIEKVLDSDVAVIVVDYPEGEFQDRSSLALALASAKSSFSCILAVASASFLAFAAAFSSLESVFSCGALFASCA